MCVITCYLEDGKVEKYSWDPSRRVNKALLQKSKASRFEIWVPFGTQDKMTKLGWEIAKRMDQSEIVSGKRNILLTFPKRELKPFPF